MPKLTNVGRTRSLTERVSATVLVVAAVVAGALVATALASGGGHRKAHHATRTTRIAVLVHHPKGLAHLAKASSPAPAGAILAAVVGNTEVYALHNSGDEDCVIHLTAGAGGGSACGPSSKVEEEGEVGIGGGPSTASGSLATVRVSALVPNGVSSLTLTDRGGSSYEIPVTNNVAEHDDVNVTSVSYTLPGGRIHTTNVAKLLENVTRSPGAPGSNS